MSAFPSTATLEDMLELIKKDTPFLALYTNNPGPTNTGTELVGGSYARQSITFGAIAAGSMSNTNTLTFSNLPSSVSTHWGIFDAVSGGNLLAYGALTTEIVAEAGDNAIFDTGDITLNLTGS
jgi:hypothetical protein